MCFLRFYFSFDEFQIYFWNDLIVILLLCYLYELLCLLNYNVFLQRYNVMLNEYTLHTLKLKKDMVKKKIIIWP